MSWQIRARDSSKVTKATKLRVAGAASCAPQDWPVLKLPATITASEAKVRGRRLMQMSTCLDVSATRRLLTPLCWIDVSGAKYQGTADMEAVKVSCVFD